MPRHPPMVAAALYALALTSCGREPTKPTASRLAHFPAFSAALPAPLAALGAGASLVVPVAAVRVTLRHDNGSTALDSVLTFASGADSIVIATTVRMDARAPAAGEPLALWLAYVNATHDTVFKGGPATVMARPLFGDQPVAADAPRVSLVYVGPGASATRIRLTPHLIMLGQGDAFTFAAHAYDSTGAELAAPVVYRSLDSASAPLASPAAPAGTAIAFRRVVPIVATLVSNGAADTAYVSIVPRPADLAITGGNNQAAPASSVLPAAAAVKVTDANGDPLPATQVRFSPANGGVAGTALATTDANGIARTSWRLGPATGAQSLAAEAVGLAGVVVTLTATATAATRPDTSHSQGSGRRTIRVESGDGQTGSVGTALPAPIAVRVVDSAGSGIAGVKVDWKATGADGSVADASTTTDARGVTSTKWTLGPKAGKMVATASASSVGSVDFSAVAVDNSGAAVRGKLIFSAQPLSAVSGDPITPAVVVEALDAAGNHDDNFKDAVTIVLAPGVTAVRLGGSISVTARKGLAVFDALVPDGIATGVTLVASATGYASATSTAFRVAPPPPARMYAVSGGSQTAKPGATLAAPLIVAVEDAHGKRVSGVVVTWSAANGRVAAATSTTDANGAASMTWTLGSSNGVQTATAEVPGLPGSPVKFTATAKP